MLAWAAALAVLGGVQFLVVRACDYDVWPLFAYAVYFALHVYLPGVVALGLVQRRPVTLTASIALGVPTGFALEIFSFLGLAALGAKQAIWALPLVWLALLVFSHRRGRAALRCRVRSPHAGIALALAGLFLATVATAASQMFAESPLVAGLPQRAIFHDWVFLVSRAATIKNLWPLEDPSLAGVALQYHYFMLVHVAAASSATGLELTQVLLRLAVLPLGAVLVVQAYALGRMVSRSAWGGVLAALLTVSASELGLHPEANGSVFLGRFTRWLYVSPTFYFGLIFFAALLLALARWRNLPRADARHLLWLCLLAAAASGAKGTVMPVVLASLGLWIGWHWVRGGGPAGRLMVAGAGVGAVFILVYWTTMAGWGTGAASFVPGDVFQVSEFWRLHVETWSARVGRWLPAEWASRLVAVGCALIVLIGTLGVRALALPYLLAPHAPARRPFVAWLGAAALVSGVMGAVLKLDADSELYVFLLVRLPTAVLAAAFVVAACRRGGSVAPTPARVGGAAGWRSAGTWLVAAPLAVALCAQVAIFVGRNRTGWRQWLETAQQNEVQQNLADLEEALVWVRGNTEPGALLLANTCTPANLQRDHWGAVDGTLAGVHYYYSALSERRLLVEGPAYLLDPVRVQRRMALAAEVFYQQRAPTAEMFRGAPGYVMLDRSIRDGAAVQLDAASRVFANRRIEIYRVPRGLSRLAAADSLK